jgi:hypothetical protein
LLAELVAQVEIKAKLVKGQEKISELNSQPQCGRIERTVAKRAQKKARTNTVLQRELDNDQWLLAGTNAF